MSSVICDPKFMCLLLVKFMYISLLQVIFTTAL